MSFLEKIGFKAKGVRKPRYQAYGKITFEEVDEVSNFKAPNLTESMLYDTKRAKKEKSVRAYKATTRDFNSNTEVHTSAWKDQDVTREWGYYHISAVQILAKWLGNTGLDIPLTVVLRDKRLLEPEQQIIGIWSTNLYTGAVYIEMFLDLLISARDGHRQLCCVIDAKAQVNMAEESKGLSLSIKTHFTWLQQPYPYRSTDYMFRAQRESTGKSIYIKPSTVDARMIPQPIEVSKLEIIRDFNFQREEPRLNTQEAITNRVFYKVITKDNPCVSLSNPGSVAESSRAHTSKRLTPLNSSKKTGVLTVFDEESQPRLLEGTQICSYREEHTTMEDHEQVGNNRHTDGGSA